MFYAEYNLRLFFYLLFKKMDAVCAIDLDTILPCFYVSKLKQITRIYDAHELFCEMKEVVTRPGIYKTWKKIERMTVPNFLHGYTVNQPIAEEFRKMYGVNYRVIRNIAKKNDAGFHYPKQKFILYQGAVNEGRSFETLIPAMKHVDAQLIICGDGNMMQEVQALVAEHGLKNKVIFKGMVQPEELKEYTKKAWIGITLFENNGMSNYYSLANRFFDYIQSGVPQLCVNYPVYRSLNDEYDIAELIIDTAPKTIADGLNKLLTNTLLWERLHQNCLRAANELNWENEERKLLQFYQDLFSKNQH